MYKRAPSKIITQLYVAFSTETDILEGFMWLLRNKVFFVPYATTTNVLQQFNVLRVVVLQQRSKK